MKGLTKQQRKEVSRAARSARAARMKAQLGETISRKAGLLVGGYTAGIAPGLGPVRTSTAMAVLGWGGALVLPGKVGSALEGVGDAGAAIYAYREGGEKRASLARDSFLRGSFFSEASGTTGGAVRQAERRAFAAGRISGVRDGARAVLRETDAESAGIAGIPSSAAELVDGQIAEAIDGQ